MANYQVHKAILRDVHGNNRNWRIKLSNLPLLPNCKLLDTLPITYVLYIRTTFNLLSIRFSGASAICITIRTIGTAIHAISLAIDAITVAICEIVTIELSLLSSANWVL